MNPQVNQNNLREEETSGEEDIFKEVEEETGIMRLDVIPMERQDICLGIVQKGLQDRELFKLHKLKLNREHLRIMLRFQKQEKPC